MTDTDSFDPAEVVDALLGVLRASESDASRVAAAKLLLSRTTSKEDDEAQKHEADERDAAFAEARGLLAEFAALKHAGLRQSRALDHDGPPGPADPAG